MPRPEYSVAMTQAVHQELSTFLLRADGQQDLLFALVARRYERGSIIVTSNRGFEAWGEILGDAMVAAALIDRLVHHAHIVTLKGKSYRLRERGTGTVPAAGIQASGLRPST